MSKTAALTFLVACAALSRAQEATAPGQAPITVNVNGSRVESPLVPPMMIDGRVMVPLRGVLQEFDASIEWLPVQKIVVARRGRKTLTLPVGEKYGIVGDSVVPLDTPAVIVDGRTMMPLRYVAEALDTYVMWDQATRTVVITSRLESKQS